MKGLTRAAAVVLISVSIAWGMALLPDAGSKKANPVFQSDRTERLTETNMVDALVGLPLELRIAKADLKQNVLSVDLFLPKGVTGEGFVYHDLYELTQFAWGKTTNVERVLIRILLKTGDERAERVLLVAMEAKRTQALPGERKPATVPELRGFLESRYHFTYTAKWKDQT
ncbi:hypothetical protein [Gorillibacterium sp. sgz5001074]|uniref:hypothetical protein n=1 Tax=Gorillibacterium sp. sgz5001074 TaxID=3446695 RepID=UPI003F6789F1